jgi:hypothetical protein
MISSVWALNRKRQDITAAFYRKVILQDAAIRPILEGIHATPSLELSKGEGTCQVTKVRCRYLTTLRSSNLPRISVRTDIADVLCCYYIVYWYPTYITAVMPKATPNKRWKAAEHERFEYMCSVLQLSI